MITESSISVTDISAEMERILREHCPIDVIPPGAWTVREWAERAGGISESAAHAQVKRLVAAGLLKTGYGRGPSGNRVLYCWPAKPWPSEAPRRKRKR